MRSARISILVSILSAAIALLAASPAWAQDEDHSKTELRVTKVAGSVYMLDAVKGNAGGNIAASVGADGIVIVDDQYAPLADKIRAALGTITDKSVRFVAITREATRSSRRTRRSWLRRTCASAWKRAEPRAMAVPCIWKTSLRRRKRCRSSPSSTT
jgi:hypothetical protein